MPVPTVTCRAKNPATCWKHGDPRATSTKTILAYPAYAYSILSAAKKDSEKAYKADDAGAFLEAKYAEEGAQADYNATLLRIHELQEASGLHATSVGSRLEAKHELEQALNHRAELLATDTVEINRRNQIRWLDENFGMGAAVEVGKLRDKTLKDWKSLEDGTPFMVQTPTGYYIDRARTQRKLDPNANWLSKQLNKQDFFYRPGAFSWASVENQMANENPKSRITKLGTNFEIAPNIPDFLPKTAKKIDIPDKIGTSYGRYAIVGEESYREFEGFLTSGNLHLNGASAVNSLEDNFVMDLKNVKSVYKI